MLLPSDVGDTVSGWFREGWDWLRDGVTGIFEDDGSANPSKPATEAPAALPSRSAGVLLIAAGVAAGYFLARK